MNRTPTATRLAPATLLALAGAAHAGIAPVWITTYTDATYVPYEFVVAPDGSSFVVATRTQGGDDAIAVTKFDPDGAFAWQSIFNGPVGQDIAAAISLTPDASSVYALGRSQVPGFANSDFTVLKYDAETGDLLWSRFWDGGDMGIDSPRDIVALPDGGVAATGGIDTPDEQRDIGTVRFDADGAELWSSRITGVGPFLFENEDGEFIAATPEGDVVMNGYINNIHFHDLITVRFDGLTGDVLWDSRRTGVDHAPRDLVIAPDGDAVVFARDPLGADHRWLVVRYDAHTGAPLWEFLVDPGLDEFLGHVTVGPDNNVYACGSTDPDFDDSNANANAITVAIDGDTGAMLWLDEFGDEGFFDGDRAADLYAAPDGVLWMFGSTSSDSIVTDPNDTEALVIKFDAATGQRLEVTLIDTAEPGQPPNTDVFDRVGATSSGDLIVFGRRFDGTTPTPIQIMRFDIGPGGCSPADLSEPFDQLDFSDVVAFLSAFGSQDPAADLAEPTGQLDFSDVVAFLAAFGAGCP